MPALHDLAWPRRTDRLLLRPATAADAPACWAYGRRPEVTEWDTTADVDEAAYARRFADPKRLPVRLVVEREGGVIGDLMLMVGDGQGQAEAAARARRVEAMLGWTIDPAAQGRGFATEAARELLVLAFDELGLRRVTAGTFAANTPSWRVMEKIGMRREHTAVAASLHRTRGWLDGYLYALLATEWRTSS